MPPGSNKSYAEISRQSTASKRANIFEKKMGSGNKSKRSYLNNITCENEQINKNSQNPNAKGIFHNPPTASMFKFNQQIIDQELFQPETKQQWLNNRLSEVSFDGKSTPK
tara:strand:+ start:84 stop:413 length:330 start_codon:yes stop_codon:yes gene_type:complete